MVAPAARIGAVEQVSRCARIRLDYDSIALGDQALDLDVGHQRDPSLARNDLTGNADRDGRAAQLLGRSGRCFDNGFLDRDSLFGHRR